MSQHGSLTLERWSAFSLDQQVLMIANELNRARKLNAPEDLDRRRHAYERVLHLTDLTIQSAPRPALCRELLRWRDLIASLYIAGGDVTAQAALRALLQLTPEASRQLDALALA